MNKLFKRYIGNEAKWIISIQDARKLKKIIKKYGIKNILDLGTGIGASALSMANALKEGHIDTIENVPKCITRAKELSDHEKITFHYSDTEIVELVPYQYGICFKDIPEKDYDLVVVDGPSFHLGDPTIISLIKGDIFRLFPKLKIGCVIYIDGSHTTVKLFKRYYKNLIKEDNGAFIKIKDGEPEDTKHLALIEQGLL